MASKKKDLKNPGKLHLDWYECMFLQRKFEEKSAQLYIQQKIRGFCHLYIGQEALSSGVVSAIKPQDNIITAYRDHGIALAKKIDPKLLMAELMGKITGCSKGKGGSMHFFDKEKKFFGGHGIVGAQIPLGAGIAMAEKYKKSGLLTICFLGDGAIHQGALSETFNMATLWSLPIIFICENNGYAMGTSIDRSTVQKQYDKIGQNYGLRSYTINAMHPKEMHDLIVQLSESVRKNKGPVFIDAQTYRYRGHSMSDPAKYRTKEEVESYKKLDPVHRVKQEILDNSFADIQWIEKTENKIKKVVADAVDFAESSPFPSQEDLYKDCYKTSDYPFIDRI